MKPETATLPAPTAAVGHRPHRPLPHPLTDHQGYQQPENRGSTSNANASKSLDVDRTGVFVPSGVAGHWTEAERVSNRLISAINGIRADLLGNSQVGNPILAELPSTVLAQLKNLQSELARVKPHAVCPTCQGLQKEKCKLCKGRGFISEFLWSHAVPEEVKRIR